MNALFLLSKFSFIEITGMSMHGVTSEKGFAVLPLMPSDAIRKATLIDMPAIEMSQKKLKEYFEKGYGIFSGEKVTWAKLRFTPERARWVSAEQWHPEQRSGFDSDGFFWLEVPYSDDRELLMDILKHGTEVKVLSPVALKTRVRKALESTLAQY